MRHIKTGSSALALGLAAITLPATLVAQAIVIEPYSQGGANREAYKEISGKWADSPESITTADIDASGSRELQEPQPQSPAVLEFTPPIEAGRDVQVALAFPPSANAKGLRLNLVGTEQFYPITLTASKANQWVHVGAFRVADGQKPVFRLTTTDQIAPAEEGKPVEVILGAIRFEPVPEIPDDPFAIAGEGIAVADPFATDTEVAALTDPFQTSTAAIPAPANVENPFGDTPAAPSPFETEGGVPVDQAAPFEGLAPAPRAAQTPVADPFATSTTSPNSPFVPVPGTSPSATSPFETNSTSGPLPIDEVDPQDPFAVIGSSPFATNTPVSDPFATADQPVSSALPPDPFAGSDPFASGGVPADPFATTDDPFGAAAPVDPFPNVPTNPLPSGTDTALPADPFATGEAPSPFDTGTPTSPFEADNPAPIAVAPQPNVSGLPPAPFAGMEAPQTGSPVPSMSSNGELPQPIYRETNDPYLAADLIRQPNTLSTGTQAPLFADSGKNEADNLPPAEVGAVKWAESLSAAQKQAMETDRPIILIFMAENAESQLFAQNMLTDKKVTDLINGAVPVEVSYAGDEPLVGKYAVPRAPYAVVLNKHGFTKGHIRLNRTRERILEDMQKLLK